MSFARAGRLCLQASSRNSALLRRVEEGSNVCSTNSLQQMRRMSGGNHGPGVTYEGLTLHPPATWHKVVAEGMTGMMWFWIFVRAYHDGENLLFGHARHYEHEAHSESSASKNEH